MMEKLKTFLVICLLLFTQWVQSQEILEAEYFFDSDPGVNNGISLSITAGETVEFAESISATGLAPGFHRLYIRVKDANNVWSLNEARSFSIQKPVTLETFPNNLVSAEYFIDTDPGVGNGSKIELSTDDTISFSEQISAAGLDPGFHKIFVRAKDDFGNWSLFEARTFYIQKQASVDPEITQITALEYFIDDDPGIGNGTAITLTNADTVSHSGQISTAGIPSGWHKLFVRAKSKEGVWSMYEARTFYIQKPAPPTPDSPPIVGMEYFVDADPGFGEATAVSIEAGDTIEFSFSEAMTGLAEGDHNISFRVVNEDNVWSLAEAGSFKIVDCDFPIKPMTPIGQTSLCLNPEDGEYSISAVEFATSYEWTITPAEAGTISGTDTVGTVSWDDSYIGSAEISVIAKNDCATGPVSDILTVNIYAYPEAVAGPDTSVCAGESVELVASGGSEFLWSTDEVTESITVTPIEESIYTVKVKENGCSDSIDVTVSVLEVHYHKDIVALCEGDSILFDGSYVKEAGEYSVTYTSNQSCDSTMELSLTLTSPVSSSTTETICSGATLTFGTQSLTDAGEYVEVFEAASGCDSSVTLTLSVNPEFSFNEIAALCSGESFNWQGEDYTTSGDYTAVYTTTAGCDSSYNLNLTVYELPATPVITLDDRTLTSSATIGNQWYLDEAEISGAVNQTHTATEEGAYFVLVTDNNACLSDTSNVIEVEFTGISSFENWNIRIYPNPVSDKLYVENKEGRKIKLEIYDLTGKLIIQTIIIDALEEIDVGAFIPSIYFLKLSLDSESQIEKIMIQE